MNKLIKKSPKIFRNFYQYLNLISRSDLSIRIFKNFPDNIRPNSLIDRSQKLERILKAKNIDFYSLITSIFIPENDLLIDNNLEITNNHESEETFQDYRNI